METIPNLRTVTTTSGSSTAMSWRRVFSFFTFPVKRVRVYANLRLNYGNEEYTEWHCYGSMEYFNTQSFHTLWDYHGTLHKSIAHCVKLRYTIRIYSKYYNDYNTKVYHIHLLHFVWDTPLINPLNIACNYEILHSSITHCVRYSINPLEYMWDYEILHSSTTHCMRQCNTLQINRYKSALHKIYLSSTSVNLWIIWVYLNFQSLIFLFFTLTTHMFFRILCQAAGNRCYFSFLNCEFLLSSSKQLNSRYLWKAFGLWFLSFLIDCWSTMKECTFFTQLIPQWYELKYESIGKIQCITSDQLI